jgi:hypothetical protein
MSKKTAKMIMLCAGQYGRAVLVGSVDADPIPGQPVTLRNARMVLYWARECGGLFGLAARGPRGDTRITTKVETLVETVWQEWASISPEAAREIDAWPPC